MVHCEPEHVGTDSCVLNCLKYSVVSVLAFYAISALVGTKYINIFNTVHGHEKLKADSFLTPLLFKYFQSS